MLIPPLWMDGRVFLSQMAAGGAELSIAFGGVLLALALLFAVFTAHEGIHGLLFTLFSPAARVKFGYTAGMLYATAPAAVYKRKRFMVIILMPFIIITAVLLLMMCV